MLGAVAALQKDQTRAVKAIKRAIEGDARYFAKAQQDISFDRIRVDIQRLLDSIAADTLFKTQARLSDVRAALRAAAESHYVGSF